MTQKENPCYKIAKTVSAPPLQGFASAVDVATRPRLNSHQTGDRQNVQWGVYNREGQRKYLTASEIQSFLTSAKQREDSVYGFCWMMAVTGCRISEALSLTEMSIDFEARQVVIRCLKKRGKEVFRAIPLPSDLLGRLQQWLRAGILSPERLWPWSRMTGYRRICEVMHAAGIEGSYATPKGLRHGFAVRAIQSNVPLNLVQRWLGHADIKTTAIYTSAMGPEERELASRLWGEPSEKSSPRKRRQPSSAHSARPDRRSDSCPAGDGFGPVSGSPEPDLAPAEEMAMVSYGEAKPGVKPWFLQLDSILSCRLIQFWLFRPRLGQSHRRVSGGEYGARSGSKE